MAKGRTGKPDAFPKQTLEELRQALAAEKEGRPDWETRLNAATALVEILLQAQQQSGGEKRVAKPKAKAPRRRKR